MNWKIIVFFLAVIFAFCMYGDYQNDKIERLEKQTVYYKARSEQPRFVEKTVRDTIVIIQQKIVEVEKTEYKKTTDNIDLLRSIGSSPSLVILESKLSKQVNDTVKPTARDSVFRYVDAWAEISFRPSDSLFTYFVRDSINILITKRYKHRLWFFRWGKKSYDINVVNFNPHSKITHFSTVAVQ